MRTFSKSSIDSYLGRTNCSKEGGVALFSQSFLLTWKENAHGTSIPLSFSYVPDVPHELFKERERLFYLERELGVAKRFFIIHAVDFSSHFHVQGNKNPMASFRRALFSHYSLCRVQYCRYCAIRFCPSMPAAKSTRSFWYFQIRISIIAGETLSSR